MITGYNSEVKYGHHSFHIQTEDRGLKAARIDTIIYRSGGAILHRKQISYKDITACDNVQEIVRDLMSEIHNKTINEVRKGLWMRGKTAVPDHSFHDTVMHYLLQPGELTGLID
jgi:hypothetical protein